MIQRIWKIGNEVARGAASFFCIVQVMGKTAWIRGVVLFLLSAGVATSVQRFVYSQDNLKPTIKTPLQEQPQREIESDTWSMRVAGLHDAVLGKEPTKEFLDGLRRVDKQDRDSYFEGLVKTWMQDDAFAEVQATWWLRDHFGVAAERLPDGEGISKTGWDLGLYRDWVKRCIRENLGYRDFVELQLFGERSEKASGDDDPQSQHGLNGIGERSRIPTAAWYLAGQEVPFSVLESPTAIESNLKGQFQRSLESKIGRAHV